MKFLTLVILSLSLLYSQGPLPGPSGGGGGGGSGSGTVTSITCGTGLTGGTFTTTGTCAQDYTHNSTYSGTQLFNGNVTSGAVNIDFSAANSINLGSTAYLSLTLGGTMTAGKNLTVAASATAPGLIITGANNPTGNWAGALNVDTSGNFNWSPSNGNWTTINGGAGKTLTFSNSLTLAGTDSTTMTFPGTSQTIPGMNQANTGGTAFTLNMGASTAATALTVPKIAGCAPTVDGQVCEDTTLHHLKVGSNGSTVDLQTGGSPGGSSGDVQMNNGSGGFSASSINCTSLGECTLTGKNTATNDFTVKQSPGAGGANLLTIVDSNGLATFINNMIIGGNLTIGGSGSNFVAAFGYANIPFINPTIQWPNNTPDVSMTRNAAGIVEINNGTPGTFTGTALKTGYVISGGTAPTITGCGTISAQHGGITAGDFTTTTTGTCAAAFALPTAPTGWFCEVQDITKHVSANIMIQSATSTTGCTVTGTTAASDVLTFRAVAY